MNILIVEDDACCAESVGEIIERWGHNVDQAKTGTEALKRFTKNIYDLVLLDIFLPDCKGHELIPQLREIWPDIGIVAMTGYNSRELELEVRQQRVLYYMIKPFEMKELQSLLDHVSQKRAQQKH